MTIQRLFAVRRRGKSLEVQLLAWSIDQDAEVRQEVHAERLVQAERLVGALHAAGGIDRNEIEVRGAESDSLHHHLRDVRVALHRAHLEPVSYGLEFEV